MVFEGYVTLKVKPSSQEPIDIQEMGSCSVVSKSARTRRVEPGPGSTAVLPRPGARSTFQVRECRHGTSPSQGLDTSLCDAMLVKPALGP